jgi:ubiquinone/menaquinone biosynthesis C-methylase UbiE
MKKNMNQQQADFQPGGFLAGDNGNKYDRFKLAMPWRDEIEEKLATTLLEKLRRKKQPRILELGFGTGMTTAMLLKYMPDAKIVAVDSSAAMTKVAMEHVPSKSVTWFTQDVLEFMSQCKPAQFDAVASGFMTHNLEQSDRLRLFDGIRHVLKNNGWFINADKYARDTPAKRIEDLAEQIVAFDVFSDDPAYRLQAIKHYLADENIRFTEREQLALVRGYRSKRGVHYGFIYRRRMEALFVSQFTTRWASRPSRAEWTA